MAKLAERASKHAEKAALVLAESGRIVSYGELDERAQRIAQWLVALGLQSGDGVAWLLENTPEVIALAWGAQRAGLYYTAISTHLGADAAAHVFNDCGARVLIASRATLALAQSIREARPAESARCVHVLVDGEAPGFVNLEAALLTVDAADALAPLSPRPLGRDMLYSSGTTGRPKGIRRPLKPVEQQALPDIDIDAWRRAFSFDEYAVYLSTGPLYHAAPLRYVMRTLGVGGTCVIMQRFDPESALALIERHRVTHSQWVPTMFVRMLDLPEDVRRRYDHSSMQVAVHAAAPCPVPVKQAMLDWWGDVIHEYYAGSEGAGTTSIGPTQWRRYPGSVGRATVGTIRIVGEDGAELPPGEVGMVYFSGVAPFAYHNDPEKTRAAWHPEGWATYGDLGYLNEEGYLFLSDRRADLIISGGVNVYPLEIENALLEHPGVADAAVIGIADREYGEVPLAVVSVREGVMPGEATARELAAHCAARLGRLKMPRRVVFEDCMPRSDAGKLQRQALKIRFREQPLAGYAAVAQASF